MATEREADRVELLALERPLRNPPRHGTGQVRVGVGNSLMWTRAVPGQIDLQYVAAGLGQQVHPAGLTPVVVERGREAVQKQHRRTFHAARLTHASATMRGVRNA